MGGFFEFIFGNLFLIIIIVSGIIGFFSNNKEQNKQQQNRRSRPIDSRTDPTPARPNELKRREVARTELKPKATGKMLSTTTIAEEQQLQMERLEAKYGITSSAQIADELKLEEIQLQESLKRRDELSEEQEVLKNDLKESLRSTGLINGIIMAEVLGKPRSLKPYETVIHERYKR